MLYLIDIIMISDIPQVVNWSGDGEDPDLVYIGEKYLYCLKRLRFTST